MYMIGKFLNNCWRIHVILQCFFSMCVIGCVCDFPAHMQNVCFEILYKPIGELILVIPISDGCSVYPVVPLDLDLLSHFHSY